MASQASRFASFALVCLFLCRSCQDPAMLHPIQDLLGRCRGIVTCHTSESKVDELTHRVGENCLNVAGCPNR